MAEQHTRPLSLRERITQLELATNSTLSPPPPLAPHPPRSTALTPSTAHAAPHATLQSLPTPSHLAHPDTRSRASSSASNSAPPSPRLPVSHILALYNQQGGNAEDRPNIGQAGLKADATGAATTTATVEGERPKSPTAVRKTLPGLTLPEGGDETVGGGAEAALQAQLASPARSRSASGVSSLASAGTASRPTFGSKAPATSKLPAPTPPPSLRREPAAKAANEPTPTSSSFSPPARSSTLDVSPSSASYKTPSPSLPPRRSSTLDLLSASVPTARTSLPQVAAPLLPPRPSTSAASSPSTTTPKAPPLPRRIPTLPSPATEPHPPVPPAPKSLLPSSEPTTQDPLSSVSPKGSPLPPSLPPKPSLRASRTSPATRKPPPPQPANGTSPARPIDPEAKRRYVRLFEQCAVKGEDRVEAVVVAGVWRRSRLPDDVLKTIWNDVSAGQPALDRESFARGLWAIDEELRRARS
ncbi:hypothetical protein JCM11251_005211 [Rhodosporidiobolus azoricus]